MRRCTSKGSIDSINRISILSQALSTPKDKGSEKRI